MLPSGRDDDAAAVRFGRDLTSILDDLKALVAVLTIVEGWPVDTHALAEKVAEVACRCETLLADRDPVAVAAVARAVQATRCGDHGDARTELLRARRHVDRLCRASAPNATPCGVDATVPASWM